MEQKTWILHRRRFWDDYDRSFSTNWTILLPHLAIIICSFLKIWTEVFTCMCNFSKLDFCLDSVPWFNTLVPQTPASSWYVATSVEGNAKKCLLLRTYGLGATQVYCGGLLVSDPACKELISSNLTIVKWQASWKISNSSHIC